MNRNKLKILVLTAAVLTALSPVTHAGKQMFPKTVPVLDGSPHEGFTIGKGTTAYSGSVDGSIYRVDLRSGEGEVLVPPVPDFDVLTDCQKLGMRLDRRSNLLFVAGCFYGDATVYDGDTGEVVMIYQLADLGHVINDIAITRDTVYFTDFTAPFLYSLPLSKNGRIPMEPDAATAIPLAGGITTGNGIVATPDGSTLIVGDSQTAQIYRVDPTTGQSDLIDVNPPLVGFIDGIIMRDNLLFILTPFGDGSGGDWVQVVALDDDLLTGEMLGKIIDPDMDGVASGAFHGDALYVNNARYNDWPTPDTAYWITRLSIDDIQP
ncbi:SMP-30/gluconolactonase/LRE family protein [Marinihelvus fidelis]|nr:SMP-30/gluconolactonase/LRE family protein [Marinihelvus fidelis]